MTKIKSVSHIFNQFWRPIFTFFSTHQQSKLKLACTTSCWCIPHSRLENSGMIDRSPEKLRGQCSLTSWLWIVCRPYRRTCIPAHNGMIGRSPVKLTSWYSLTSQLWIVHCQYMSHLLRRHGLLVVAKVLDQSIKDNLIWVLSFVASVEERDKHYLISC